MATIEVTLHGVSESHWLNLRTSALAGQVFDGLGAGNGNEHWMKAYEPSSRQVLLDLENAMSEHYTRVQRGLDKGLHQRLIDWQKEPQGRFSPDEIAQRTGVEQSRTKAINRSAALSTAMDRAVGEVNRTRGLQLRQPPVSAGLPPDIPRAVESIASHNPESLVKSRSRGRVVVTPLAPRKRHYARVDSFGRAQAPIQPDVGLTLWGADTNAEITYERPRVEGRQGPGQLRQAGGSGNIKVRVAQGAPGRPGEIVFRVLNFLFPFANPKNRPRVPAMGGGTGAGCGVSDVEQMLSPIKITTVRLSC